MEQEQIKIEFLNRKFVFHRMNDSGEWQQFSDRSKLRRLEQDVADFDSVSLFEILSTIIDEYDGADIVFSGAIEQYNILEEAIDYPQFSGKFTLKRVLSRRKHNYFVSTEEIVKVETPQLEEVIIDKDFIVKRGETLTFKDQIIYFKADVKSNGTLKFENCVIHYNNSDRATELTMTETASLSMNKCTVINHGYYEDKYFLNATDAQADMYFKNCEFVSCCWFLKAGCSVRLEHCKMVNLGDNFLHQYRSEEFLIINCTFIFVDSPAFFPPKTNHNVIDCWSVEFTQCSVHGSLQIPTAEAAAKYDDIFCMNSFINIRQAGNITKSIFCGVRNIINTGTYSGHDIIVSQSIFSHCFYCMRYVIKVTDCRFDHCSKVATIADSSSFLRCQFNDCVSNLINCHTLFRQGVNISSCEFNSWQAPQASEEPESFNAKSMISLRGCKNSTPSRIVNCIFNKMQAHYWFLITGDSYENIDRVAVYVKSCSFNQCITERRSGQFIRKYGRYLNAFKKWKEQQTVSWLDCHFASAKASNGCSANVTKKVITNTGEPIGVTLKSDFSDVGACHQ